MSVIDQSNGHVKDPLSLTWVYSRGLVGYASNVLKLPTKDRGCNKLAGFWVLTFHMIPNHKKEINHSALRNPSKMRSPGISLVQPWPAWIEGLSAGSAQSPNSTFASYQRSRIANSVPNCTTAIQARIVQASVNVDIVNLIKRGNL